MTRPTKPATFTGAIRAISDRHDLWSVWSDFVEMVAIAISNSVDMGVREAREARYMRILERYDRPAVDRFAAAFGALVVEFEAGITDVLGSAFMLLELGSKWAGQFFTPFPVCRMMAAMQVPTITEALRSRSYVTASDPAVGAGAMPLALCAEMKDAGINYQRALHVTAQDIDERAAHMCYIQLALAGVPAVVIVGDTLRAPGIGPRWYTPAHVLGGWTARLSVPARDPVELDPALDPAPVQQLSMF